MPRLPRSFTAAALAPILILVATEAAAHPNHGPTFGERQTKLDLRPERSRIVYGLTYTDRYGLDVRRRADGSGDGVITAEELEAEGAAFMAALAVGVRVLVDGEPVDVQWAEPFIGPADAVRPGPLAMEAVATYAVPPGEHLVTLEEHAEFEGIYRTVVTAAAASGVELRRMGRGMEATDLERRLVFLDLPTPGDPPPRTTTVAVTMPGEVPTGEDDGAGLSRWWALAAAGGGILLLVVIAVVAAKKKRS